MKVKVKQLIVYDKQGSSIVDLRYGDIEIIINDTCLAIKHYSSIRMKMQTMVVPIWNISSFEYVE